MNKLNSTLSRLRNRCFRDRGFTLIELVIVVAVIGIIAAIAIPQYNSVQTKARQNIVSSAAADGYKMVSVALANGETPWVSYNKPTRETADYTLVVDPIVGLTPQNLKVTVTSKKDSSMVAVKGPLG